MDDYTLDMDRPDSDSSRFTFRKVTTHLRPPRLAVLLKQDLSYWQQACLSIHRWTSQVWGGRYVPIIPTDGNSISEPFWRILETFDPDYLFHYQPIGLDLKDHDSDRYADFVDRFATDLTDEEEEVTPEHRNQAERQVRDVLVDGLELSSSLEEKIVERFNPFHRKSVVCRRARGRSGVSHPLTDVTEIASSSDLEDTHFFDLSALPIELRLLTTSAIGDSSGLTEGVSDRGVDPEVQEITLDDLDSLLQKAWEPKRNDLRFPYDLTNLHCASAYRIFTRAEDPDVVVFGSSLEDYDQVKNLV